MRSLHAVLGVCLVVSAAGAAFGQAASGTPVDADTFREQQDPGAAAGQTDQQLHTLLQQTLGNPGVPANTGAPPPSAGSTSAETTGSEDPSQPANVWLVGMGQTICSDWLKSPARGLEWVGGFWTGMNTLDSANHNVGKESGIDAVTADLKKRCTDHPQETLYVAASEIYVADMKGGK
jgi:hypothetical protein